MKLKTKDVGLIVCFTALYVVFGFLKISPIIGLPGQAITAAAIMAPLSGIVLGPYIGTLSTFFGGIIGFFYGSFSPLSFASGIFATLGSGLVYKGKQIISVFVYFSLLLLFAFYPAIGAAWLYPASMWFQIIGLITLISPLQSIALKRFISNDNSKLFYAFFVTSLTSTMAGQIAGSITLEIIHVSDVNYFKTTWEAITFLYPIERTIIAVSAAFIGVSLYKVLKSADLMPFSNSTNCQEKCS